MMNFVTYTVISLNKPKKHFLDSMFHEYAM